MIRVQSLLRALTALAIAALLGVACTPGASEAPAPEPAGQADDNGDDDGDEPAEPADDAEPTELELALSEIAEQVSVLRELPLLEDIDIRVVDSAELAELVTDRGSGSESMERTVAVQRVLIALRHLSDDADLRAIYDDLLTTAVLGLYDPQDGVAYVSSEAEPLGPAAASTAAHELLHALQDQHFDLGRLDELPDDDGDAILALLSVAEGDAVILEEEWAASYQSDEERAEAEQDRLSGGEEQARQLQDAPSYIVEQFVFPYIAGERFVAALVGEGGYEAVNAALADPPTTTLEILEPSLYLDGFEPAETQAGGSPGEDWDSLLTSTFGVFDLLALFGASSSPEAVQGSTAWTAWRGGALQAWERGDELVVAVGWTFEDTARAGTVCDAVGHWYEDVAEATADGEVWRGDRDVLAVSCEGTDVRFALAPDSATALTTVALDDA